MSAIEQAIKDAVEKGKYFPNLKSKKWRVTGYSLRCEMETGRWPFKWKRWEHVMRTECIFLDPFFWQALGKARGWKIKKCPTYLSSERRQVRHGRIAGIASSTTSQKRRMRRVFSTSYELRLLDCHLAFASKSNKPALPRRAGPPARPDGSW
jgi:hypothetical protein